MLRAGTVKFYQLVLPQSIMWADVTEESFLTLSFWECLDAAVYVQPNSVLFVLPKNKGKMKEIHCLDVSFTGKKAEHNLFL